MSYQSRERLIDRPALFVTPSTPSRSFVQRMVFTLELWRQRIDMRRRLAEMDARSLHDAGISPAAAAYESGKAFWEKVGSLR